MRCAMRKPRNAHGMHMSILNAPSHKSKSNNDNCRMDVVDHERRWEDLDSKSKDKRRGYRSRCFFLAPSRLCLQRRDVNGLRREATRHQSKPPGRKTASVDGVLVSNSVRLQTSAPGSCFMQIWRQRTVKSEHGKNVS